MLGCAQFPLGHLAHVRKRGPDEEMHTLRYRRVGYRFALRYLNVRGRLLQNCRVNS